MKHSRHIFRPGTVAAALVALAAFSTPAASAPLLQGLHLPPLGIGQGEQAPDHVVPAQAGNGAYRIGQLEEQIRTLNGRIEELGFQLLQMQERMRQMQEDNEFRFQQLEGGGNAAGAGDRTDAGPAVTEEVPMDHADNSMTLPGVENSTTASTNPGAGNSGGGTGTPPRTLGTITFDENGNPVGTAQNDLPNGSETAALDNPADLYSAGYSHMLAGDYPLAEQVFRDFIDIYPNDPKTADAMFWLGEAQYSQGQYTDAAQTFLEAHKKFPQGDKGADTMLKLGMSLAALDKREPACATYRQLLTNYPGASQAIRTKVQQQQTQASC